MTHADRIGYLIWALTYDVLSVAAWCWGVYAALHGDYARGAFFVALALGFDSWGNVQQRKANPQ